ncbi:MAG: carboxypeptidase-like regulatory domain-containing protein [Bacteroidales bacterium]
MGRTGHIKLLYFIITLFIASVAEADGQEDVLRSVHSFRNGNVRTLNALNIISRRTGYYFTYDSRLIDPEVRITLDANDKPLEDILRQVIQNDSVRFTVIGNHIIFARIVPELQAANFIELTDDTYRISGLIVDYENGMPLPFATIAIQGKPRGTISNSDGFFSMTITNDLIYDTLTVSYLGFMNRSIPVTEALGNNFTIKMFRDYIPIPEIIIRSQIPQEIIRKAVESIPVNYGTTPASMWGFYREGIMKKKEIHLFSEAVLKIYKAAYGTLVQDQVKVVRSRKLENVSSSDTLMLRLKAGLSSSLMLDGMKNVFEFLDEEYTGLYQYAMTDIVTVDDAAAYVVEFSQRDWITEPLFRGSLMINTADYAIMQAEFEVHPSYISGRNFTYVTSSARGFTIKPVSARYRTTYKKTGDRYYLSHVRGDLKFTARKRRSLFNTNYEVFFELAITEADTLNVIRFDRNEIIPLETVFSRTITGYDPDFWGKFDFLKPGDDLLNSLNSIPQRLSRFIEEEK